MAARGCASSLFFKAGCDGTASARRLCIRVDVLCHRRRLASPRSSLSVARFAGSQIIHSRSILGLRSQSLAPPQAKFSCPLRGLTNFIRDRLWRCAQSLVLSSVAPTARHMIARGKRRRSAAPGFSPPNVRHALKGRNRFQSETFVERCRAL